MAARRFPPPWSVEDIGVAFVVRDHGDQALAYVYFEEEPSASLSNKTGRCERAAGHSASASHFQVARGRFTSVAHSQLLMVTRTK